MRRRQAVFFDLDNTLCDTIGTRANRLELAFEVLSREYPHLEFADFSARVLNPEPMAPDVRGMAPVLEEMGLAGSPAAKTALGLWYFVGCEGLLPSFKGSREVLADLSSSHVLGVVTNGEERLQSAKLRAIGVDGHISHLVCSESIGYAKPDPRIFHHALSLAGVTAEDAVFVGDSLEVDVAGAKATGIPAIWFNPRGATVPEGAPTPDSEIREFAKLPRALGQLDTKARWRA